MARVKVLASPAEARVGGGVSFAGLDVESLTMDSPEFAVWRRLFERARRRLTEGSRRGDTRNRLYFGI